MGVENIHVTRDDFLFPEHVLENYEIDLKIFSQPMFDILWQAAAQSHSPSYKNGKWAR
jgi:hypothetical protein